MVHALRRIRAALAAGGVVVDTQPVSPRPPISAAGRPLGHVDMREWLRTIEAVDALVAKTVETGLYSIEHEHRFTVTDRWDSGPECAQRRWPAGKARDCRTGSQHESSRLRRR